MYLYIKLNKFYDYIFIVIENVSLKYVWGNIVYRMFVK